MPDQRKDDLGSAPIVAALLLGGALVGSAFNLAQSLDGFGQSIRKIHANLTGEALAIPAAPGSFKTPGSIQRVDLEIGDSPVLGPADAPVTIVEWADFQCPYCSRVLPSLAQILREYGDRVRIVFKHMPLPIHPQAATAHAAAEAAYRQERFWMMHDMIFAAPNKLDLETFKGYAEKLELDIEQFEKDLRSESVQARIAADQAQAEVVGVTGTPSFFINGRFLSGARPYETFKQIIEEELRKADS